MPKVKTNRSTAKRFRVTGGGKVMRKKAFHSHLLSSKTRKRKRALKRPAIVEKANLPKILRQLGL